MQKKFEQFLRSSWGLELWLGDQIVFRSKEAGVAGLLAFIKKHDSKYKNLVVFYKIVGRGAALLAVYLKAKEVYGALGSKLAVKTLREYKVKFYFVKTVPHILNRDGNGLCPIEKLSLDKTPAEFYNCLNERGRASFNLK